MKAKPPFDLETDGLSACGIWVRRQRPSASLADEALSLAQVLQTWNLMETMDIEHYHCAYAEISGPDLQPTWVYLVEIKGRRTPEAFVLSSHPLSQVADGDLVRLVALVQPTGHLIPGALVETRSARRMLWPKPAIAR